MPGQFFQIALILCALFLSRCAQIVPLTGGERDRTPPVLLQALPAENTLNFQQSEIILRFNEYVLLKDLSNQLMVSPRLPTPPEITAVGKEVIVKFKPGELRPNTTYRLDFGKAIADMNESNSIQGYHYVFSTGHFIDSLKIGGVVTTASNNAVAPEVLVGLYMLSDTISSAQADSLPYILPPDYSARSDAGGLFEFDNLPGGSFRIFALKDNNRNNLYDGEADRVAFYGDTLMLPGDSGIALHMFNEESPKLFIKKAFSPFYGMALVVYNKNTAVAAAVSSGPAENFIVEDAGIPNDTITILYKNIADTLSFMLKHLQSDKIDTVNILLPAEKVSTDALRKFRSNVVNGRIAPATALRVRFNVWMDTARIDSTRLRIHSSDDTLIALRPVTSKWLDLRTLEIFADWRGGFTYHVQPDTGFVYDHRGITNDTAVVSFRAPAGEEFSKLKLNILADRKQSYVIQLFNLKGAVVAERTFLIPLSATNRTQHVFENLPPDTYKMKLIYDDNANGKWDTGNLVKMQQPEKVFIATKEFKLLADWEAEEEVLVETP